MADWDGLRRGLEESVTPPPLSALRARRQRREQRRVAAVTCALVLVGSASGAALFRERGRGAAPRPPATAAIGTVTDRVALGSPFVPRDQAEYVVTDVDFVDRDTGWAIGLRCVGERCDVATWRTGDGGTTWGLPVPVASGVARTSFVQEDPRGGAARSLRMVDENDGFAFNPDLYVTHDGARTWHRVPQPSKVASVSVVEDSVWVTEHGCAVDDDCAITVRSGTAGRTFALRDVHVPSTRGSTLVRRSATFDGYLLSWGGETVPALHRTEDSGKTWTPGPHPCGEDPGAAALTGAGGDGLWLVCSDTAEDAGKERIAAKRLFRSRDRGRSWQRGGDLPAAGEVTDLVGVSATTAYATTQLPGRLLVTTDGGATWHVAAGTATKGYGYANVSVVDPRHVWAMGDAGILWRTRDGNSWERLALPPGAPRPSPTPRAPRGSAPAGDDGVTFTGISFYDADHGYAVGRRCAKNTCRAVLRRTADGGRNWRAVNAPTGTWVADDGGHQENDVADVTFADARNGWLWGPNLFVTHDGGATWKADPYGYIGDVKVGGGVVWFLGYEGCAGQECGPSVGRQPVGGGERTDATFDYEPFAHVSLSVVDEDTAYVVDDGRFNDREPVVRVTNDGGHRWHPAAAPCRSAARRVVSASGPDDVWVACTGADGASAIAHSVDGGATFTTQRHDAEVGMLRALSPALVYAPDAGGMTMTRDGGRTWHTQPGIASRGGLADLALVDARHGFALYPRGTFYRTTDGESWERMTPP